MKDETNDLFYVFHYVKRANAKKSMKYFTGVMPTKGKMKRDEGN